MSDVYKVIVFNILRLFMYGHFMMVTCHDTVLFLMFVRLGVVPSPPVQYKYVPRNKEGQKERKKETVTNFFYSEPDWCLLQHTVQH